jgi:hypothetical protein
MKIIVTQKLYLIMKGKSLLIKQIFEFIGFLLFSYGAMWLTYEQVVQCNQRGQLRGSEPLKWFKYITQNGVIHPLSILSKTEL